MKNVKRNHIIRFIILAAILVVVNVVGARFHKRFDLTKEKRFSLSDPTKVYVGDMKEAATVTIYLDGKLPAGFQRLQNSVLDILKEFNEYSGGKIQYRFENPLSGKSTPKAKQEVIEQLAQKGVQPVNLQVQQDEDDGGYSEKIIFPWALVAHNGKEYPVSLLENHRGMSPQEVLDYSGNLLEYKFAQSIQQTTRADKPYVAYTTGNGQPLGYKTMDMLTTLGGLYNLDTLDLNTNIEVPQVFDAIIITAPKTGLDEKAKFKIDQYVMNGGRVLWMIDRLNTSMKKLQESQAYLAAEMPTNLEDILFKYGVRINPTLVEDVQQNAPIPVTVGMIGDKPDIRLLPWLYFPYAVPSAKHPIVHNMDAVLFQFANSIDTIAQPGIKKTVLLHSSNRSRTQSAPLRISLSDLKYKPNPDLYRKKQIPMAVLLEGKFSSNFANRLAPQFLTTLKDSLNKPFLSEGVKASKQIVIGNGDVFYNDFSERNGPMECGYYKFTKQNFANKRFLLNCIEYLVDDSGLIKARSKDLSLRLLDAPRVKQEKLKWQLINIGLPIVLTIAFGSLFLFFRRKRYTGKG